MNGDAELFEVLADLEAEAETLHHLDREAEVADRSRAEYQDVLLEARLMASKGSWVTLTPRGAGSLNGMLTRVGDGWCGLESGGSSWTVRTATVLTARGLSERAVPRVAWSRLDMMGVGSVLRRHADASVLCAFLLVDGSAVEGRVLRVGGDFVEVLPPGEQEVPGADRGAGILLSLDGLAAIRTGC